MPSPWRAIATKSSGWVVSSCEEGKSKVWWVSWLDCVALKPTAIRRPVLYAIGCPNFAPIKLLAQHLTQPQLCSPHSVLHCPQHLQPISLILIGYFLSQFAPFLVPFIMTALCTCFMTLKWLQLMLLFFHVISPSYCLFQAAYSVSLPFGSLIILEWLC